MTTLLVTHDQEEALSIADQVAVMRDGRFTRVGTPQEVYLTPGDRFTAEFLGDCVLLAVHRHRRHRRMRARSHSRCTTATTRRAATLMLRPEQLVATTVSDDGNGHGSPPWSPRSSAGHDVLLTVDPGGATHRSPYASTASTRRRSTRRSASTSSAWPSSSANGEP